MVKGFDLAGAFSGLKKGSPGLGTASFGLLGAPKCRALGTCLQCPPLETLLPFSYGTPYDTEEKLRLTEKLSSHEVLAIEAKIALSLSFEAIITNFAHRKAR